MKNFNYGFMMQQALTKITKKAEEKPSTTQKDTIQSYFYEHSGFISEIKKTLFQFVQDNVEKLGYQEGKPFSADVQFKLLNSKSPAVFDGLVNGVSNNALKTEVKKIIDSKKMFDYTNVGTYEFHTDETKNIVSINIATI